MGKYKIEVNWSLIIIVLGIILIGLFIMRNERKPFIDVAEPNEKAETTTLINKSNINNEVSIDGTTEMKDDIELTKNEQQLYEGLKSKITKQEFLVLMEKIYSEENTIYTDLDSLSGFLYEEEFSKYGCHYSKDYKGEHQVFKLQGTGEFNTYICIHNGKYETMFLLEDYCKNVIANVFDEDDIQSFAFDATQLKCTVIASGNISKEGVAKGILMDMWDALSNLQFLNISVVFNIKASTIDLYGNDSLTTVTTAKFSRETINQINFSEENKMFNAVYMNFPKIADDFWMINDLAQYIK